MSSTDKRKYQRLAMKLALSCRNVGSPLQHVHTGQTVNVSPGGLYFETATDGFEPGNLMRIELSIPPTAGLLELGGKISSLARVLRTHKLRPRESQDAIRYGVAVEFCQSPHLEE